MASRSPSVHLLIRRGGRGGSAPGTFSPDAAQTGRRLMLRVSTATCHHRPQTRRGSLQGWLRAPRKIGDDGTEQPRQVVPPDAHALRQEADVEVDVLVLEDGAVE